MDGLTASLLIGGRHLDIYYAIRSHTAPYMVAWRGEEKPLRGWRYFMTDTEVFLTIQELLEEAAKKQAA